MGILPQLLFQLQLRILQAADTFTVYDKLRQRATAGQACLELLHHIGVTDVELGVLQTVPLHQGFGLVAVGTVWTGDYFYPYSLRDFW